MLAKIGIDNLENKRFDFFSIIKTKNILNLESIIDIQEVVSLMNIAEITNKELLEDTIYFEINLKIKLVYKSIENTMHIHNENFLFCDQIQIQSRLDGSKIFDLYMSKKLGFSINIIDFKNYIFDKNKIEIHTNMILGVDYIRGYSLAIISQTSEFEENILLCFENGQNLRQITFCMNCKFLSIKWYGRNTVGYIKKEENSILYIYDIKTGRQSYISEYKKVLSYDFLDDNNIILNIKNHNKLEVVIYNIQEMRVTNKMKVGENIEINNVCYREDLEKIFFVKNDSGKIALCSVDITLSNFNEYINLINENIYSIYGHLYIVSFNDLDITFYDYIKNRKFNIKYPKASFNKIRDFDFYDRSKFVILYEDGEIYFFNDIYKRFEIFNIEKFEDIKSIKFSYDGNLLVTAKVIGYYNLYKINYQEEREEILGIAALNAWVIKRY
ncbi:MAG: hypothetical protein ACRC57_00765 [Sarcina sp.]